MVTWVYPVPSQRFLNVERGRQKRKSECCDVRNIVLDLLLPTLKMEEEGHRPRHVGIPEKLQRAKKWILPESFQKGMILLTP